MSASARETLDAMSDDQLRGLFARKEGADSKLPRDIGRGQAKKAKDKDKDKETKPQRPPTLQELLSCPLSNIFEVRLGQADIIRVAGNDAFKRGDTATAVQLYTRALQHCAMDETRMSSDTHKLRQAMYTARDPLHLNLARCYLKTEQFRECIASAHKVSRAGGEDGAPVPPPLELKALVLLARAHGELGEYDEAEGVVAEAVRRAEMHASVAATQTQTQAEAEAEAAGGDGEGRGADDEDGGAAEAAASDSTLAASCHTQAQALLAIVACAPQIRQEIALRSRSDRKREKALWAGALGPPPKLGSSVAGSRVGVGVGAAAADWAAAMWAFVASLGVWEVLACALMVCSVPLWVRR